MSTEISELLSVQTNHSFYTGVRIKRNGGVQPHFINNFFCCNRSVASFKKESSILESIIEGSKQFASRTVATAKCRNEIASRITRGRF